MTHSDDVSRAVDGARAFSSVRSATDGREERSSWQVSRWLWHFYRLHPRLRLLLHFKVRNCSGLRLTWHHHFSLHQPIALHGQDVIWHGHATDFWKVSYNADSTRRVLNLKDFIKKTILHNAKCVIVVSIHKTIYYFSSITRSMDSTPPPQREFPWLLGHWRPRRLEVLSRNKSCFFPSLFNN